MTTDNSRFSLETVASFGTMPWEMLCVAFYILSRTKHPRPTMVLTPSTMVPLGTQAPDFSLPDTSGKTVSLKDFSGKPALLVVFMCNHCPYVKHVAAGLAELAKEYQAKGAAVVGISSNDVKSHPDDAPAKMAAEVQAARLHVSLSL